MSRRVLLGAAEPQEAAVPKKTGEWIRMDDQQLNQALRRLRERRTNRAESDDAAATTERTLVRVPPDAE